MQLIELNGENKILRTQIEALRKDFLRLFDEHEYMVSHEKELLYARYLNKLGQDQHTILCLQTEVSALRMKMQLVQAYINRGEKPNVSAILDEVDEQLKIYYEQIQAHANLLKSVSEMTMLSDEHSQELKQLYRMLVRRLHPDMNPNQTEREADLFLKAQTAYKMCDLDALRKIVMALELEEPVDSIQNISDLEVQKRRLEQQISELRSKIDLLNQEFPFNFRKKLADQAWLENEKAENMKIIAELTEEKKTLERYFSVMIE